MEQAKAKRNMHAGMSLHRDPSESGCGSHLRAHGVLLRQSSASQRSQVSAAQCGSDFKKALPISFYWCCWAQDYEGVLLNKAAPNDQVLAYWQEVYNNLTTSPAAGAASESHLPARPWYAHES